MQKARGGDEDERREWITQGGEAASLSSMDLFVVPQAPFLLNLYISLRLYIRVSFLLFWALFLHDEP